MIGPRWWLLLLAAAASPLTATPALAGSPDAGVPEEEEEEEEEEGGFRRVSEDELFPGGGSTVDLLDPDGGMLGPQPGPRPESGPAAPPIEIGASYYQEASVEVREGLAPAEQPVHVPTFMDAYLDARPDPRLRGLVRVRLAFDPVAERQPGLNPALAIDQLWLRFDVGQRLFVTAGVQHLRWGPARFWMTNDIFHVEQRNPLVPFDPRSGTPLLKLHVPWEDLGWNFYAVLALDNPAPAGVLGGLGAGARAELVVGPAEVGLSMVARPGLAERYEADVSTGLGPVDVYAEVTVRPRLDEPLWRRAAAPPPEFESYDPGGPAVGATAGVEYATTVLDTDQLTIGLEYSYHSHRYDDPGLYPQLAVQGQLRPLSLAPHYLGLVAFFSRPGRWDDFATNLLAVVNLSDRSAILRAGAGVRLLQQLNLELFGQLHLGQPGTEMRLGAPRSAADPTLTYPLGRVGLALTTAF